MGSHSSSENRQTGRVKAALDRLAEIAADHPAVMTALEKGAALEASDDFLAIRPQKIFMFKTGSEMGTVKANSLADAIGAVQMFADGQPGWVQDTDGTRHTLPRVSA